MMSRYLLQFFLLLNSLTHGLNYKVVSRKQVPIQSRKVSSSPEFISYDGDLDRIVALAFARANVTLSPSDSNSTSTNSNSSLGTSDNGAQHPLISNTTDPFKCQNSTFGHLEILIFKYSIETVVGANISMVIGEVEEILLEEIAPSILSCRNKSNEFANIVAIDSQIPADSVDKEKTCKPVVDVSNKCTVVNGRMRLFLSSPDSATKAIALSLKEVEKALGKSTIVNKIETGLRRIEYIPVEQYQSPNLPITVDSTTPSRGDDSGKTGLSTASSTLVGLGSALIIAFVAGVYFLRQSRRRDNNSASIQESGSSLDQTTPLGFYTDPNRPTSPFSEMLPGAYRMGDLDKMSILSNSNMSPVYEDDDASRSVVVSESGYTTEAAGTDYDSISYTPSKMSLYTPEGESEYLMNASLDYLGARPRDGTTPTSDLEMSESEYENGSDVSSQTSPQKYSTSLLLPQGSLDESMQAEDLLLFENQGDGPLVPVGTSLIDISLSDP